jgi:sn-glycerol 3-phosphate transport system permease protein
MAVSLTTIWLNIGFTHPDPPGSAPEHTARNAESAPGGRASPWSTLRHITRLKALAGASVCRVISTIIAFQSFGQIHIFTSRPLDATNVIVYSIHTDAFIN